MTKSGVNSDVKAIEVKIEKEVSEEEVLAASEEEVRDNWTEFAEADAIEVASSPRAGTSKFDNNQNSMPV